MAIRDWYEREMVQQACRKALGVDGNVEAISAEIQRRGVLLSTAGHRAAASAATCQKPAWRLIALARALEIDPALLTQVAVEDLLRLITWLDEFPESVHGAVWLKVFETAGEVSRPHRRV